jgi:hypothetical protein
MNGCLRLVDLPTPEPAVLIRKAIGLKRRKRHPGNLSQLKFATAKRGLQRRQRAWRSRVVSLSIPKPIEQRTGHNATATEHKLRAPEGALSTRPCAGGL